MADQPPRDGRTTARIVVLVPMAAYAWFASATRPFTTAADVTTAVPLVALAVVYVLQLVRPDGRPWERLPADQPPAGGAAAPWIALAVVLAASEGASFFAGPRSSHPTLSSLSDTVFRWHAAKAAAYGCWLWLSWYFVRR